FVDGGAFASGTVDPVTGQASFSTQALGVGSHTITASYNGSTNFQAGQSGSISQSVNRAQTQPSLVTQAVRNRQHQITSVKLTARVRALAPGSGVPTGTVTFFVNSHAVATKTLADSTAVLTLTARKAMNKTVYVRYNEDVNFHGASSSKQLVTTRALKSLAR